MKVKRDDFRGLPWRHVVSSNVRRVAYIKSGERGARRKRPAKNPKNEVLGSLYVEFRGGNVYHYDDVTPGVASALVEADSPGGFLSQKVKGTHPHEKIVVEVPPYEQEEGP